MKELFDQLSAECSKITTQKIQHQLLSGHLFSQQKNSRTDLCNLWFCALCG